MLCRVVVSISLYLCASISVTLTKARVKIEENKNEPIIAFHIIKKKVKNRKKKQDKVRSRKIRHGVLPERNARMNPFLNAQITTKTTLWTKNHPKEKKNPDRHISPNRDRPVSLISRPPPNVYLKLQKVFTLWLKRRWSGSDEPLTNSYSWLMHFTGFISSMSS